ncbi:prepilin-type N-terminal cleavage/methylation domain-containing protein [Oceanobacillus locisalsi]|uniref:Prepilin-type N-terminal cleavage/methylation domain-containing protein n=1 Tax=Oceanobacillus locisalsi TaxID=546107 RepID=A0ABW3NJ83_9BACI
MKAKHRLKIIAESGFTLVETLVSVVLLGLVLTIFLTVFTQSAAINKTSEEVVDASYLAQKEMENLYALSQRTTDYRTAMEAAGYTEVEEDSDWMYYTFHHDDPETEDYYTQIRLEKDGADHLHRVVVEVYQQNDDAQQVKMQNVLAWGQEPR